MSNDGEQVCNLCYPDLLIYGEVVPGFIFAYQEEECRDVPAGYYILFGDFHHPFVFWPQKPIQSTYDQYTNEEVDSWPEDDPRHKEEGDYIETIDEMEKHFEMSPTMGYHLTKACIEAGWNWQNSGMLLFWLSNQMAKLIPQK